MTARQRRARSEGESQYFAFGRHNDPSDARSRYDTPVTEFVFLVFLFLSLVCEFGVICFGSYLSGIFQCVDTGFLYGVHMLHVPDFP